MWGISIIVDFRPMGLHAMVVFGLGNLLFKSVLGHCVCNSFGQTNPLLTLWPNKTFISPSSQCKNYLIFITLYTVFRFPTIYLCCLIFISTIGGSSNLFAAKYTKDSFTLSKSIYLVLFFDSLVTSLGFIVIQGMLDFQGSCTLIYIRPVNLHPLFQFFLWN